jgi:hypothetical protein
LPSFSNPFASVFRVTHGSTDNFILGPLPLLKASAPFNSDARD